MNLPERGGQLELGFGQTGVHRLAELCAKPRPGLAHGVEVVVERQIRVGDAGQVTICLEPPESLAFSSAAGSPRSFASVLRISSTDAVARGPDTFFTKNLETH